MLHAGNFVKFCAHTDFKKLEGTLLWTYTELAELPVYYNYLNEDNNMSISIQFIQSSLFQC